MTSSVLVRSIDFFTLWRHHHHHHNNLTYDALDFTVLFTFVGLVPVVFWTSGGKFHYIVVWQQLVLKVPQIISQWWLGHSLGGKERN